MMLDLHMHSAASDGTDTAEEIVTKCAKLGLRLSSVTDHDNIDAQPSAIRAAKARGVRYITGVEFSVRYAGELHILGYGMDVGLPSFSGMMGELQRSREERVHLILKRLLEQNIAISYEDVRKHAKGNTLGRPHVALALVERGYAPTLSEAFDAYLNENGLCYVTRRKLNAKEAIGLILEAGGVPVLAHPRFVRTDDLSGLVRRLADDGLAGIEAYYPAHSDREIQQYVRIAQENGLIVTAGSDYHGTMRAHAAIACEKRTGELLERSVRFLTDRRAT